MTEPMRPRGRPKDGAKKLALIEAARELFLSRGPDVAIDEIALAAGVSKSTLYANFTGKDDLIEAVIRREADKTITEEHFAILVEGKVTGETLVAFGIGYIGFVNSHDLIGWDRVIASVGAVRPDLSGKFFELGPGRGQRFLEQLLEKAQKDGLIVAPSTMAAADQLTGLWLGFNNLEIKLGVRAPLQDEEIATRVRAGVEIFLRYYGAERAQETR